MSATTTGGGGDAGADGPDGFVGDDDAAGVFDVGQAGFKLASDYGFGCALSTLAEGFADAEDGYEAGVDGGFHFLSDYVVALAHEVATLGVADDDVLAESLEHGGGDFAGEGA